MRTAPRRPAHRSARQPDDGLQRERSGGRRRSQRYPRTAELFTELSDASPEFREPWAEHRLKDKTHGRYVYRHPVVGELDLGFETLRLPDDPDQALIAHTVEEDSPSHTALRLLAGWAHETLPTG
ncbi:hypothetical protein [Streptomyces lydicus]|uniref:MmyB family transcriptional regulator n=1 Tax=Streptomyces lydicus TaxID=47763 RepID=UPI001FCB933D|nr:hypothetical protein [Streptomyces lydicus]